MPAGQGEEERFDAAVEQGTPPGTTGAIEFARELEIVAMLRSPQAAVAYGPTPDARARAKARLLAALAQEPPVTPPNARDLTAPMPAIPLAAGDLPGTVGDPVTELLAVTAHADEALTTTIEPVPAAEATSARSERVLEPVPGRRRRGRHQLPSRPPVRDGAGSSPARRGIRRRVTLAGVAAMALMVALTGAGVLASRDALPGDGLYAMKRIAESTGLAFTFDDSDRAHRHLALATLRLDEVEQLLARQQATPTESADEQLFRDAILDFDTATGEGVRTLLSDAEAEPATELADLRAWAADQAARLSGMRSVLPLQALADADSSIAMLDRLLGRTDALQERSTCSQVDSGQSDTLGPIPFEGECVPADPSRSAADTSSPATGSTPGDAADSTAPDSSTTGLPEEEETEPLPGDGAELPDATREGSITTSAEPDQLEVPLPLPLLPRIALPPLSAGLPGVTIG